MKKTFNTLKEAEDYFMSNYAKTNNSKDEETYAMERWLSEQTIKAAENIPTPSEIVANQMNFLYEQGKKIAKEEKAPSPELLNEPNESELADSQAEALTDEKQDD